MHLSMLSPRVGGWATLGKLTPRAFPWVGILTFGCCPGVGNLTWPPSWKTERTSDRYFDHPAFPAKTMRERKVSESGLFSFKYTQTNTSFTLWSCVYKYINCLRFFLFFMIAHVFIFMSTLDIDYITNANYFSRFCYSGSCAVR